MTQRPLRQKLRGGITLAEIKRKWPHHVALAADKVRGVKNSEIVWSFAGIPRATAIYFLPTGYLTTICFLHFRKKLGLSCAENITEVQNGLDQQCHGRVWLNPPFDRYKVGSLDCPACRAWPRHSSPPCPHRNRVVPHLLAACRSHRFHGEAVDLREAGRHDQKRRAGK